jgi:hypothetical protein
MPAMPEARDNTEMNSMSVVERKEEYPFVLQISGTPQHTANKRYTFRNLGKPLRRVGAVQKH